MRARLVASHWFHVASDPRSRGITARVHQNPEDPRRERRLPLKSVDGPVDLHERFLNRVLRVLAATEQIPRHRLHASAVEAEKLLVRRHVPLPAAFRQFEVRVVRTITSCRCSDGRLLQGHRRHKRLDSPYRRRTCPFRSKKLGRPPLALRSAFHDNNRRVSDLATDLLAPLLNHDPRAIARVCTLVENRAPGHEQLLKELFAHSGRAFTLGITGAPGAGKSTLTSALLTTLRAQGKRVAVIAVDPSSPFSGGALLGDRVRMQEHHADPGVFIRSMATRGALGGLAPATHDIALVLDAAGFDWIVVETVGVGQDEVDVARLAHLTAVVLAPGMGDSIQAIKAGILEIADLFVINKSDLPGAPQLEADLADWGKPVVQTVATTAAGIGRLIQIATELRHALPPARLHDHWAIRLRQMYAERMQLRLDPQTVVDAARRVAGREADPYTIIEGWLKA